MSKFKSLEGLFARRHFDREVIILCVRWYLRYELSLRDLVEMMTERGLSLAHTTILRRVKCYSPEFVKRWNRFGGPTGQSWRVDETYIKLCGNWVYLFEGIYGCAPELPTVIVGVRQRRKGQATWAGRQFGRACNSFKAAGLHYQAHVGLRFFNSGVGQEPCAVIGGAYVSTFFNGFAGAYRELLYW